MEANPVEEAALLGAGEPAVEFLKLRGDGPGGGGGGGDARSARDNTPPGQRPMTWTKLFWCGLLLGVLVAIPCLLYSTSELVKYWYAPLMGLASTIPSAGAPVAGASAAGAWSPGAAWSGVRVRR